MTTGGLASLVRSGEEPVPDAEAEDEIRWCLADPRAAMWAVRQVPGVAGLTAG